jgi:hypothetical protein
MGADPSTSTKLKKPIKSVNQLRLETNDSNPIPILSAFVANKQNERVDKLESALVGDDDSKLADFLGQYFVFIVYGSQLSPKIEKLVSYLIFFIFSFFYRIN